MRHDPRLPQPPERDALELARTIFKLRGKQNASVFYQTNGLTATQAHGMISYFEMEESFEESLRALEEQ